jgi:hypothetical protein
MTGEPPSDDLSRQLALGKRAIDCIRSLFGIMADLVPPPEDREAFHRAEREMQLILAADRGIFLAFDGCQGTGPKRVGEAPEKT